MEGIKGLYQDKSGRFYVRVSISGIDKQKTITPKHSNFSGLEQAAERALKVLRREIMDSLSTSGETGEQVEVVHDVRKSAKIALQKAIKTQWERKNARGNTAKHLMSIMAEMCLCTNEKTAKQIDDWNFNALNELLEDTPAQGRNRRWRDVKCTFNQLIKAGIHHGNNPASQVTEPLKAPKDLTKHVYTWEELARIYNAIPVDKNALQIRCVFRLCGGCKIFCVNAKSSILSYGGKRSLRWQSERKNRKTARNSKDLFKLQWNM